MVIRSATAGGAPASMEPWGQPSVLLSQPRLHEEETDISLCRVSG